MIFVVKTEKENGNANACKKALKITYRGIFPQSGTSLFEKERRALYCGGVGDYNGVYRTPKP